MRVASAWGNQTAQKSPYTASGFKDASTNADQIDAWWKRWPDALIGVPTGARSRLFVIDIDPVGFAWYREHADRLTCGCTHRTRRDGYHLLYRMPSCTLGNSAGKLTAGVDTRGEGGYIVWWPAHGLGTAGMIREPGRNDFLSREALRMRRQGANLAQLREALRALNNTRCAPPLNDAEVCAIAAAKERNVAPETHAVLAVPEPLRRPLPPADPYPLDALGSLLGSAARRLHEVVQAPAALCAQSILTAASLVVQAHADVEMDGRRELLSLAAISIAESGERKSATDRLALYAHREFERTALAQYQLEQQLYETAAAAYEASRRAVTRGKKTAAAIRNAVEDAVEEMGRPPTPPTNPILLAPTPTLEGLHKLYANGRQSRATRRWHAATVELNSSDVLTAHLACQRS